MQELQLSTQPKDFFTPSYQDEFFLLYFSDDPQLKGNPYQVATRLETPSSLIPYITQADWFLSKLASRRREQILDLSEQTIQEILMTEHYVTTTELDDDNNQITVTKADPNIMRIKLDAAKFGAERLGKDKGYSQRIEKQENQTVNIFHTLNQLNQPSLPSQPQLSSLQNQPTIINVDDIKFQDEQQ